MLEFGTTNVFYRQIRNLVFDTRAVAGGINAIHWPSSQATSIQNCIFQLSSNFNYQHTGIFVEGGSGGMMSDLVFNGGKWGARFGNQQYTMRNLAFTGCETAIHQIWNWGWTYKSLSINQCNVGLNMAAPDVGSATVLDSTFNNVKIAMITGRSDSTGRGSLMTANVNYTNTDVILMGPNGTALLLGNPQGMVSASGYAIVRSVCAYSQPPDGDLHTNSYLPRVISTPLTGQSPTMGVRGNTSTSPGLLKMDGSTTNEPSPSMKIGTSIRSCLLGILVLLEMAKRTTPRP